MTAEAQKILQTVAKGVQESTHEKISQVVTHCLRAVFPEDDVHSFRIRFEKKRGRTEAYPKFYDRKGREIDPVSAGAGGWLDVASFGLRIATLVLERPGKRKFLSLDEPFKSVHGDSNRERLAQLILQMSEKMKLQILMATGLEWLRVGKVIDLSESPGRGPSRPRSGKSRP